MSPHVPGKRIAGEEQCLADRRDATRGGVRCLFGAGGGDDFLLANNRKRE